MKQILLGVSWSSTVTGGVQSIETPGECQQICDDSSNCNAVTWYDGNAKPHSDYCEMFLETHQEELIPCSNCTSGPEAGLPIFCCQLYYSAWSRCRSLDQCRKAHHIKPNTYCA